MGDKMLTRNEEICILGCSHCRQIGNFNTIKKYRISKWVYYVNNIAPYQISQARGILQVQITDLQFIAMFIGVSRFVSYFLLLFVRLSLLSFCTVHLFLSLSLLFYFVLQPFCSFQFRPSRDRPA
jgi:hypothetical protein